ncbi:hypothetical protein CHISP_1210 [Chitinispirillum alkaliphilum]|nr:hypothetical protein CHISP_1210 [Chitinispirillum alkaliphilum]
MNLHCPYKPWGMYGQWILVMANGRAVKMQNHSGSMAFLLIVKMIQQTGTAFIMYYPEAIVFH